MKNNSQQMQLTKSDKGFCNRSPLKLRDGDNWKELSDATYSHEKYLQSVDVCSIGKKRVKVTSLLMSDCKQKRKEDNGEEDVYTSSLLACFLNNLSKK